MLPVHFNSSFLYFLFLSSPLSNSLFQQKQPIFLFLNHHLMLCSMFYTSPSPDPCSNSIDKGVQFHMDNNVMGDEGITFMVELISLYAITYVCQFLVTSSLFLSPARRALYYLQRKEANHIPISFKERNLYKSNYINIPVCFT